MVRHQGFLSSSSSSSQPTEVLWFIFVLFTSSVLDLLPLGFLIAIFLREHLRLSNYLHTYV